MACLGEDDRDGGEEEDDCRAASDGGGVTAAGGTSSEDDDPPYFERQSLLRCALHVANCTLGGPFFDAASFGAPLAARLAEDADAAHAAEAAAAEGRPFGALLRRLLGDWSADELIAALESSGCTVHFHSARLPFPDDALFRSSPPPRALILNVHSALTAALARRPVLGWVLPASLVAGRHWLALVRTPRGAWWNCDSRLAAPRRFDSEDALVEHVRAQLDTTVLDALVLYVHDCSSSEHSGISG